MNKKRFCIEREMAKSKGQRRKRIVVKETRPGRENLYESNKLLQMSATFFGPTPCPLPLPTAQLIDIETYLCASLSIFHLLSWFAISFFGIGEETDYCQEIWIIQHTIVRFLAAFLCYGFGQNASAMVINANELMKSRVFFLFCFVCFSWFRSARINVKCVRAQLQLQRGWERRVGGEKEGEVVWA